MKKLALLSFLVIVGIFSIMLISRQVDAQQAQGADDESKLTQIMDRLDKIESQLEEVLENQQQMFVEFRRGRYFTKRS